ncbi:HAMP domain-containing histidine kinase [Streptosporangiaceae bacterium NEAU-GS5]|nr:HAMP domain-containing histidine kinase [Streptosporangiaceae bacterium NEAU-GS5]
MTTHRNLSITTRITLFTGVVAVALSAMLAATVMFAIHRSTTDDRIDEIIAVGGRVARQVERGDVSMPLAEHSDRFVQIVDPDGRVETSTPQLEGKPPMADFLPARGRMAVRVVCGGVFPPGECNIVAAQLAYRGGQDWVVYSSSPPIPAYVKPWLAGVVLGAMAVMAAAITILGHRIVVRCLSPVIAIRAELDRITDTCRPDHRVPLPQSRDEIHDLADSVNGTLARLEAAMLQQRQFTSDASHELRTPIAAIRAEVEDALYAPEDTSVTTLGNSVLPSVDRLEAIVGALLTIQRLEAGQPITNEPIDLAQFVASELTVRPPHRDFTLSLDSGVIVIGDRERLAQLFINLVDNAERYATSSIAFHVRQEPSAKRDAERFPCGIAVLEVTDDGPGIDPDKRELVFQRLARLDTARDRQAGGTGLGLPIARQIAETHGGTLRIDDSPQGTRFVLRLPVSICPE